MNVKQKIKLKKKLRKKSHSVFEGLKEGPFTHTQNFFFCQMFLIFFQTSYKMNFVKIQKKIHKNMQVIKRKEIIDRKVFKL